MNYEEQAKNFAKKHGIELRTVSSEYGRYFLNDKDARHIFNLELSRNGESYHFSFGQSIAAGDKEPTMYDVLSCLTKYDPETFEDFCDEFGYDQDSRSAERVYNAVVDEWENVDILFGDILDELCEIQ